MSSTNSADHRQKVAQDIISAINAAENVIAAVNRAANERKLFACSKIASELARPPGQFTPDREQRFRILAELASWFNNENFTDDEMLAVAGEPPRLQSLREILKKEAAQKETGEVTIDLLSVEAALLIPPACKRFLEQSDSERAALLCRVWFPASDDEGASEEAILHRLSRKFKKKIGFIEPPVGIEAQTEMSPLRRRRKKTKEQTAKEFIAATYPEGITAGVSYKEIARRIEVEKGVKMDSDTVARAHKKGH
jgi:hypothetical protein